MNARTRDEVEGLKAAGVAVRSAFDAMVANAQAGMTTRDLDNIGAEVLAKHGARSAPQLYYDFPGATCISVNEEAAHGIPEERVLQDGDMINIDVSANRDGFVADMGQSFVLGEGTDEQARICKSVREAVESALKKIKSGRPLNIIGETVQKVADREGYTIVKNLGSHGVGRNIHEEPSYVPFDNPEETRTLERGLVLTIEPFFCTGTDWVYEEADGWTLSVPKGELVEQFEHTLIVTDNGPVVVTGP